MPSKHAVCVTLTEHFRDFVDELVATGRFRTTSEVMRAGLRLLEEEQLRGNGKAASSSAKPSAKSVNQASTR
jgi:putative addiction module CopG family antidote